MTEWNWVASTERQDRIETQIKHAQARLRAERRRQLQQYGELIVHAGLDTLTPAALLGLLLESATQAQDTATVQRWQEVGTHALTDTKAVPPTGEKRRGRHADQTRRPPTAAHLAGQNGATIITAAEREALHTAYTTVGEGRSFVRIHRLREHLQAQQHWDDSTFERVLRMLAAEGRVELHGGDPRDLTEAEQATSFRDGAGTLFVALSWQGYIGTLGTDTTP